METPSPHPSPQRTSPLMAPPLSTPMERDDDDDILSPSPQPYSLSMNFEDTTDQSPQCSSPVGDLSCSVAPMDDDTHAEKDTDNIATNSADLRPSEKCNPENDRPEVIADYLNNDDGNEEDDDVDQEIKRTDMEISRAFPENTNTELIAKETDENRRLSASESGARKDSPIIVEHEDERQVSKDFSNSAPTCSRNELRGRSNNDSVMDVEEVDDESDKEEDDDPVECADCNKVFGNLQIYMDHTCGRLDRSSRPISPGNIFSSGASYERRDGESFRGNIIYNPDGSTYIIESSSRSSDALDRDLDELNIPLVPESIIDRADQSVMAIDRSIPQIASATFIPHRGPSSVIASHLSDQSVGDNNARSSPIIHNFQVYSLQTVRPEDLLQLFPAQKSSRHPSKPILMCFICKLSFGSPGTFLQHAVLEHSIRMGRLESEVIGRPTASAIIQALGADKRPIISVLHPTFRDSVRANISEAKATSVMSKTAKPKDGAHDTVTVNMNFLSSSSVNREINPFMPSVFDSSRRSPPDYKKSSLLPDLHMGSRDDLFQRQRSSILHGFKNNNLMRDVFQRHSPPGSLYSNSQALHGFHQRESSVNGPQSRQAQSKTSLPPQRMSSSPSGPPDHFLSTTVSQTALPPHLSLSSMPGSLQPPPMGVTLPNFLGTCDEHPQGKAQGVECPKCDMVLGSSQSLGGHMTMTHSRNSCKTLKCPKCNWHYKYQETLEIHMKEKHPDSDAQCVYCLTNQAHPRLARGESYSCGYKPYRCEVCNYSTTTKGNLSIHMQSDKHINNMQDLANGGAEMKMPSQPVVATQSLPASAPPPSAIPASYIAEDAQYKKMKQKQSFRCDVCSYETSVARNLRIHMTSEKHTHNMLVMTQSINHLHQDMTLHQMGQMNQLLALNQQEQAARLAAMTSHLPGNLFSYEQAAMLMSAAAVASNPPPPHPHQVGTGFEIPMNLTKENVMDDIMGQSLANKDASKMFTCAVCNKYSSDSMENVHNHIQYDRTKGGNSDSHVTFNNGTYHCNLCTYKTHLKANFQLHCKTDKHLQKLQLVNHIQEGGPENEWRLNYPGSPMQICCNACSFFANSTHKMQLHVSTLHHESCAQLFRHLQLLDRATPPPPPGSTRFYHCSLCQANVRSKQKLILHSRSPQHVRHEQALPQGQVSIFDVYLLKEMGEGDKIDFEDGDSTTAKGASNGEDSNSESPGTSRDNNINVRKVTTSPTYPGTHGSTSAEAPHNSNINNSNATGSSSGGGSSSGHNNYGSRDLPYGVTKGLGLPSRPPGSPTVVSSNNPFHNSNSNSNNPPARSTSSTSNNNNNNNNNNNSSGSVGISNGVLSSSQQLLQRFEPCLLCPLCRHEYRRPSLLEEHLIKEHHVAAEGVQRLMCMVEMPTATVAAVAKQQQQQQQHQQQQIQPPAGGAAGSAAGSHLPSSSSSSLASSSMSSMTLPTQPLISSSSPSSFADSATQEMSASTTGFSVSASLSSVPATSSGHDVTASSNSSSASSSISSSLSSTAPTSSTLPSSAHSESTSIASAMPPTTNGQSSLSNHLDLTKTASREEESNGISQRNGLGDFDAEMKDMPLSTTATTSTTTAAARAFSEQDSDSVPPRGTTSSSASSNCHPSDASRLGSLATHLQPKASPFSYFSLKEDDLDRVLRKREINMDLFEEENTRLLVKEGVDLSAQERLEREFEEQLRCQTCQKAHSDIDQLYSHQNELGHLELKQTPRGPGYLCWKKGCNQYFKTASSLQVHFREIHARRSSIGLLNKEDLEQYKHSCEKCTFVFKSAESLQQHTLVHIMRAVTSCGICSRTVSSVTKMKAHLETDHAELGSGEIASKMDSVLENARILFKSPTYEQFTSKLLLVNGDSGATSSRQKVSSRNGVMLNADDVEMTNDDFMNGQKENIRNEEDLDESDGMSVSYREQHFLEDYMNSHSMAEEHYKDSSRKFKCHVCKVAYTNPRYLYAHNRTAQHRQAESIEATKQKVSSSATHKLKANGELPTMSTSSSYMNAPRNTSPLSSSPQVNSPTPSNGNTNGPIDLDPAIWGNDSRGKPYKCNICKVSYNNAPSLDIHMRSVAHKAKANKLGELIQTGQVDVNQALIEHPDPKAIGKQQAQMIADMIHQQATAQAASNAVASFYNLPSMANINAMAQLSLLQGLLPGTHAPLPQSAQNALAAFSNAQLETYEALRSLSGHTKDPREYKESSGSYSKSESYSYPYGDVSASESTKEKLSMKLNAKPDASDKITNMVIKQDGRIEPAADARFKPQALDKVTGLPMPDLKGAKKEEELPPNFPHAPILARPRGFMGRFKPQLHRSLLENFGFECVMHFNEEHCKKKEKKEEPKDNENKSDNEKEDDDRENKDADQDKAEKEVEKEEAKMNEEDKEEENKVSDAAKKTDDNKENIDLPEIGKMKCKQCDKDFSNVWVLKNHEEDIHKNFVAPDVIEDFGQKFKEEWEKSLPKIPEDLPTTPSLPPSAPTTPTLEKAQAVAEMPPPPPPPSQPTPTSTASAVGAAGLDMAQLLPLMGLNLLPMHLPMNLMNLGLQNSLMPSLIMPPGLDISQSYLSQLAPPPHLMDSTSSMSSQQQLQAAAAAAAAQQTQNQKRVRTRISDDQLKVLRQYFDINNSPSEEQINKMSEQTGLPQKVIKHWFRNTLFKERQRNKDSPYNFNNPPSTSIDLDEYDRTGKIPEVKMEPEDEVEAVPGPVQSESQEVKKEHQLPVKEEVVDEKYIDQDDVLENPPLKIDLTVKSELSDEGRKDQDSHSSASSPSNPNSIPSTPNASAPATPTPMISMNALTPNPFSLDAYAANMARLEAATFQSMGKRANRTRFTDYQIKTLQEYFERNAYPKDDELEHLSKLLGLSARVIVVWFQNARQKARKIYENQPANDQGKDPTSPFQRTPGLNYQCKKCNSVFQRYYELIKHQKNSCVGESNNNKPIPSMADDDSSNYSFTSNEDSCFSDRHSTPSLTPQHARERDILSRSLPSMESSMIATAGTKHPNLSVSQTLATSTPSSLASGASSIPSFKCDKCSLTFHRFDAWQDHQKAHSIAPAMFTPAFSSSSAFGMLQTLAHQEDSKASLAMAGHSTPSSIRPIMAASPMSTAHQPGSGGHSSTPMGMSSMSTSPSPSSTSGTKRKTDSEDEGSEQPRDKRLRTTILPEQLDYLYQQYQIDCNPSRKQLEHIASTVNLKKRVVQVWFQNTRARERKGHYRAHQQLINKRCPFCRALFRAKSALESHLATKHPEEMAKGEINVDLIPDAMIEPPQASSSHAAASLACSTSSTSSTSGLPSHSSMSNYMSFMSAAAGGLGLPFPAPTPDLMGHPSFEDPFFKKYMSDLATSMAARQEPALNLPSPMPRRPASPTIPAHSTPKPSHFPAPTPTNFSSSARPLDAHKPKPSSTPIPSSVSDDAPLDLSKPVRSSNPTPSPIDHSSRSSHFGGSSRDIAEASEKSFEMDYLRRVNSLDDSFSETQSEMADQEYLNDEHSSPPSPQRLSLSGQMMRGSCTPGGSSQNNGNTPGSSGKRYRTQMSAIQVKVMKHLFVDYKTPTMAECELLGQEIGLAKRVVQVWFQNARAKEKKAKLSSGKPFNAELDFPKSPEECKLCNYKYSHKVTVQDHIFTKSHIDKVKAFLSAEGEGDLDLSGSSLSALTSRPSSSSGVEHERSRKLWDDSSTHLAQLKAMGISPSSLGYPMSSESSKQQEKRTESPKKEKKEGGSPKDQQVAMEMAMNAQMMSALGGYMPGLDPAYLSYMYGGLPGYFPAMGLPGMGLQAGLMPGAEHMMAFDPLSYGTPLALLQIPPAAIKSVGEKLSEAGAVLARYTQDCQALADLHSQVSSADLTVAAEATLDVGYICKKCQIVYPARDSCIAHQRTVCMASQSSLPKGFEPIMKLEQVQYECRACNERFSTIVEFKGHCQQESHKSRLIKFKAMEAARRESTSSPTSPPAAYSSASRVITPSSSAYASSSSPASKHLSTTIPMNNNNNNNSISPTGLANAHKTGIFPSPHHQLGKGSLPLPNTMPASVSPSSSSSSSSPSPMFRDKPLVSHPIGFSEMQEAKRLKADQ